MKQNSSGFSRRGPDIITEELVAALLGNESFEFKALFDAIHLHLRERNAYSGGEEMLRLRAYEKLQMLVYSGVVKKNGKSYRGSPAKLAAYSVQIQEFRARMAKP